MPPAKIFSDSTYTRNVEAPGRSDLLSNHSGQRLNVPWSLLLAACLWLWAVWACAEHWRGNPNYSYGWIVPPLALAFGVRRLSRSRTTGDVERRANGLSSPASLVLLLAVATGSCLLEFCREEVWHPQFVLLAICGLAAGATIWLARADRAVIFPALFFFTAVPWPPRVEQPVTSWLMQAVANTTAEALHWLGIEAETAGSAIALHGGLVGITEACSGIRSLQSGIMFGLAMGEWFSLRTGRRIFLLVVAIVLAFATNLARTLALSAQAQWHGVASVEAVHDLVGNIVVTAMILGIWAIAKLLARGTEEGVLDWSVAQQRLRELTTRAFARRSALTGGILVAGLIGFTAARAWSAHLDAATSTQTKAFFNARAGGSTGNQLIPIPRDVWNELRPSSGEYVQPEVFDRSAGNAAAYHFFWKPSPWNRFALVHRPDICMPGIGWTMIGSPTPVGVSVGAETLHCHAFRFQRGREHALELWGVWRNGDPVPLDYQAGELFGNGSSHSGLQLAGKRRSATEIVACSIVREGSEPEEQAAIALLQSSFSYQKR